MCTLDQTKLAAICCDQQEKLNSKQTHESRQQQTANDQIGALHKSAKADNQSGQEDQMETEGRESAKFRHNEEHIYKKNKSHKINNKKLFTQEELL